MATRKPRNPKPTAETFAKTPRVKAAAKKTAKRAPGAGKRAGAATRKSPLYLCREEYKETIDALVAQGLEREDAVLTLRVGIRQANGRPVPAELLAQCVNDPFVAFHDVEHTQLAA